MKKMAFFGGTFDPIHFGHINLAVQIFEKAKLDKIIFCPANISPQKEENPPYAKGIHRYEMTKIAIEGIDGFDVSDIEIKRKNISYTVDTLLQLHEEFFKGYKIYFIMAEDTSKNFSTWKDPNKILQMATPLIGYKGTLKNFDECFSKDNFIEINTMDISSTHIRNRLKKKLYCGHLIPAKVLDYIYDNQLYY